LNGRADRQHGRDVNHLVRHRESWPGLVEAQVAGVRIVRAGPWVFHVPTGMRFLVSGVVVSQVDRHRQTGSAGKGHHQGEGLEASAHSLGSES
jgi:hypothetical protein